MVCVCVLLLWVLVWTNLRAHHGGLVFDGGHVGIGRNESIPLTS